MQVGDVTLRPYQEKAVEKFRRLQGALLSFDTRGGKSMVGLALSERLYDEGECGPTLIISDATSPWTRDIDKIGMDMRRLHMVDRPRRIRFANDIKNIDQKGNHFYQIHWAGLHPMRDELRKVKWLNTINDEAHKGKNRDSLRTKALKLVTKNCPYKLGLTADPSDNAPEDIWSLLNWLYPKRFSSFWRFVDEYIEVETNYGPRGAYKVFKGPKNVEKFQEMLSEFYISMTLEEIDPGQIPDSYEDRFVELSTDQRKAYEDMVELQMSELQDDLLIADFPMIQSMRLMQFAQAMGRMETHKVWRKKREWDNKERRYVVRKYLDNAIKVRQIEPSSKLDDLMYLLVNDETPTIVFTQFTDIVDMACERMRKLGIPHVKCTGSDNVEVARETFQEAKGGVRVIIGTTSKIAESIELDRADREIFLDAPRSPRLRHQAVGRGKAVGKRRQIKIIDIKARDTIDATRLDVIRTRAEWIDALLGRMNGRQLEE